MMRIKVDCLPNKLLTTKKVASSGAGQIDDFVLKLQFSDYYFIKIPSRANFEAQKISSLNSGKF